MEVGIDDIEVYVPNLYLDMKELERYRNFEEGKITKGIGIKKMAVPDSYEDSCTMPAMSIKMLMEKNDLNPEEIGRIYVGSESRVDHSKPNAAYVAGMLEQIYGKGSFERCDVVDFTFACIGATDALHTIIDWIRSGSNEGKYGIVVSADISKYELGSGGEYTQGAGSVAMLVSENPRLITFEKPIGVCFRNERDFFRPLYKETPVFDGHYSNECYKETMKCALIDYEKKAIENGLYELSGDKSVSDYIDYMIFHIPYPKMAEYMAAKVFIHEWRNKEIWNNIESIIGPEPQREDFSSEREYREADKKFEKRFRKTEIFKEEFSRKIRPTLIASSQIGNIYTGSLYLGLYSLVVECDDLAGKRVGFGSYGSGAKAKVFSGIIQDGVCDVRKKMDLLDRLERRKRISIKEYEELHEGKRSIYESICKPHKEFALVGIGKDGTIEGYRFYEWLE